MLESLETPSVRGCPLRQCRKAGGLFEHHDKVGRVIYPETNHPQHELACRQRMRGGNLIAFDVGE